ncbi:MAG: DNA polymerase III subunit alpha, partial [bacterium]
MSTGFIHLHLHTSYSLLDGACRPEDAVQAAVANEMPAVSITDHGVLYGAMEFYKAARRQGIKPVIGCEAYVARDSSGQAHGPHTDTAAPDHLLLLAETDQGYRNLIQLVSSSFLASPPPRPRTSKATLASCRKGLIAISAGRSGEAARHILAGNFDEARRTVREYAAIFGKDNFFLEIQDHGLESEARVNAGMSRLAAETGVPLVATNNVHYIAREHAWIHEVLLCLQSQTLMSDTARPTLPGSEYCFKSAAEMESLFGWSPGAVARSGEIADRCDVRLGPSDMHFPTFPVPAGHSAGSYLEHLCFAGLRDSFGIALPAKAGDHAGVDAVDRARRELDIIRRTGYANYYLVVWDFVQFARRRGIPVGLRGSGGASLVAYAMGITDIDPVRHSLVFEMFLNPGRAAPPDFDIDVCQTRRGEVIAYLQEKYPGRVAHIVSFNTFGGRMAVRDAA